MSTSNKLLYPDFCQCGAEITSDNKPQKYSIIEQVVEGKEVISEEITACNTCLKFQRADS